MSTNKITGSVAAVGATVTYTAKAATSAAPASAVSDASGNHTSPALPAGSYVVTASDPAGLVVYNSFDVILNGADVSGVNLRSRLKNASNAQENGF